MTVSLIRESKFKSWGAEVQTVGGGDAWTGNGIFLPTKEQAEEYAKDLSAKWTLVTAYRVVQKAERPNYSWLDGGPVAIKYEDD